MIGRKHNHVEINCFAVLPENIGQINLVTYSIKDTHRALSMILFFPRYTKNKIKTHNMLYIVEKIIKFPKY